MSYFCGTVLTIAGKGVDTYSKPFYIVEENFWKWNEEFFEDLNNYDYIRGEDSKVL